MMERVALNELDGLDVSTVEATQVAEDVIRAADQVAMQDAVQPKVDGKYKRKRLIGEISALTGLLRAQADADDSEAASRGVTHEVMTQRLQGLQSALAALPPGTREGEDAWSESSSDADGSLAPSRALAGPLVESERERQIRLGEITPFQNTQGATALIRRTAAQPVLVPAPLRGPYVSESSRLSATATRLRRAQRDTAAAAPLILVGDAEDLSEEELAPVRRPDFFMPRKSLAEQRAAAKAARSGTLRQRRQTLAAAPPRRKKRQRNSLRAGGVGGGEEVGTMGGAADAGPLRRTGKSTRRQAQPETVQGGSDSDSGSSGGGGTSASASRSSAGSQSCAALSSGGEGEDADEEVDGDPFDDADSDWYEHRVARAGVAAASRAGDSLVRAAVLSSGSAHSTPPLSPRATGAGGASVHAAAPGSRQADAADALEGAREDFVEFDGGFQVPAHLYDRLFPYQQVGVKWLWELHQQRVGGVLADEMGLGKTIQVVAFLAGLHRSGHFGSALVVAPVTTLRHWQRELRAWYPLFRVLVLHATARSRTGVRPSAAALLRKAATCGAGVVLTSYEQLRRHAAPLLATQWGYVVLDEGHRIRNPDAEITLMCKQVNTAHRIIMTGTPIQNRLTELWSLFDFVFPGKLGTLPVFQAQFGVPIQSGGYANASALAVAAAFKCAVMLRDMISPYLLRRCKVDVAKQLPEKTEQVLFCTLTPAQRKLYRGYLGSRDVAEILDGRRPSMEGITMLRKICNHADLVHRTELLADPAVDYGAPARSSKLTVTMQVLSRWRAGGHKALVFTQTQQMLDILESNAVAGGFRYHRLDGSVPAAQRFRLIDDFNGNPAVFLFLLTTRVGGIGVNLTAADRVLLYDPDWNPATDIQARERAWRLGQRRPVTIYRLLTRGTIEEKVYHRQIFKHALSTRILQDPRQRRYVASRGLRDLFTLTDRRHGPSSETGSMFASLAAEVHGSPEDGGGDGRRSGGAAPVPVAAAAAAGAAAVGARADASGGSGGGAKAETGGGGADEAAGADGGDRSILQDLFAGTGLHSALDHSVIEGATSTARSETDRVASGVAAKAAHAIAQSRAEIAAMPINTPTWTGRAGSAGAPRFGAQSGGDGPAPSSAAIIAHHRRREAESRAEARLSTVQRRGLPRPGSAVAAPGAHRADGADGDGGHSAPARSVGELRARLVHFLAASTGHSASSGAVLARFSADAAGPLAADLKPALKRVATLVRAEGVASWVLKPEYR